SRVGGASVQDGRGSTGSAHGARRHSGKAARACPRRVERGPPRAQCPPAVGRRPPTLAIGDPAAPGRGRGRRERSGTGTAPPGAPPRPSSTRTVDAAAGTAARLLPVLAHDVTTWRALAARHPGVFLGYARAKCPGGGSRPNSTAPGGHNAEPARAALARRSTAPPGRPHDPITTGLGGDPRRRPPGARRKRRPCGAERRECAHGRFEG